MATNHTLDAQVRNVLGKKVRRLRKQGQLPATVYGKGVEPISIQLDDRTFNTVYRKAGRTSLITLNVAGKPQLAVFVQEVQRHPVTRTILHADLKAVDLKTLVYVEVPIVAIGESPLVGRGDALLNHALNTVMVEALPAELPQHIEVDISGLDSLDKSIQVSDLPTSPTYKILTDPDTVLLSLSQMRQVEEEPVAEVSVEPELVRRPRESDEDEE